MNALFVYGTLRPGILMRISLKTSAVNGWPVRSGTFYERGWGAAADFPGLSSTPMDRA
jgi:gamma-glutamylcyclotransferase (GGCT)/AIG2-like uncharacterized protein YtfP